jgi:hypothetical protein
MMLYLQKGVKIILKRNNLDAGIFQYTKYTYETEFKNILSKIIICYNKSMQDNENLENNEEYIRDYLYKHYLNKDEIRNELVLNYNIVTEAKEYGKTQDGYTDIKIFHPNSLKNTSLYYVIECKILNNKNLLYKTGLNGRYVSEGIKRFTTKKYLTNCSVNGMIGFVVEKMNLKSNYKNINIIIKKYFSCIKTEKYLKHCKIDDNFKYSYFSIHKTADNEKIKLYHLMFDYTSKIKQKIKRAELIKQ